MFKQKITLIRDRTLTQLGSPCVATIGNFDGLHLGHQRVIEKVIATAHAQGLPAVVITFEPPPQTVLRSGTGFQRIMRFSQKLQQLQTMGVQELVSLRFNAQLAKLSAADFMHYLVHTRQVRRLVVCKDFRFGHQQQGNVATLQALNHPDFSVEVIEMLHDNDEKLSSTGVRQALQTGDLDKVANWLGRPYMITGRVAYGAQRGRLLGFPTANIPLKAKERILKGIYISQVWADGTKYNAVTNVGCRPTVDGLQYWCESYLLNFSGNLYGKRITVEFLKKIRDEIRFKNKEALCSQIAQDVQTAHCFF
jgi:riboflavin kinase/FMN adenylyltransferase